MATPASVAGPPCPALARDLVPPGLRTARWARIVSTRPPARPPSPERLFGGRVGNGRRALTTTGRDPAAGSRACAGSSGIERSGAAPGPRLLTLPLGSATSSDAAFGRGAEALMKYPVWRRGAGETGVWLAERARVGRGTPSEPSAHRPLLTPAPVPRRTRPLRGAGRRPFAGLGALHLFCWKKSAPAPGGQRHAL